MKKFTFPLLLATALVAASCSNDETSAEFDDSNLSRIELGGANATSRAGFTGSGNTTLKLHYVSTRVAYNESTFPYNDAADKTDNLYMTSSATAAVDGTGDETSVSAVTQTTGADGQQRYWDDIHGKNSKLALYAIAVPNKTSLTNTANSTAFTAWDSSVKKGQTTSIANTISWTVSTTQTLETVKDEDLTYSKNVSGDNSLVFNKDTKKFDIAKESKSLQFNHTLSRFTINVKKGNGFGDFDSEFIVSSVLMTGMNTAGTLDVSAGSISSTATGNVETVGSKTDLNVSESKVGYTFVAQVVPGTTLKDVATTMLTIVVDGNNYYISGNEIYTSLINYDGNSTKEADIASIKPGKNYNLTITVNKTSIAIASARLVDWDTINGTQMTPSNAIALTTTMEQSAGETTKVVASDLYRSTNQATGYTTAGNKTTLATDNTMGETWYWPDNSTSYYLRTISPQGTTVTSGTNDNITMIGGAIATTNDFIWGAPLEEKHDGAEHTFDYSSGYDTYLHPAIGATSSEIHITQFHMMSNLQVNLSTSTGDDQVDLSNATVEILGYYNTATLALSNAAITKTGDKVTTSGAITANSEHTMHTWRVIPQSTTGITFKITAAGNIYVVNLPAETGISDWHPGKAYVYNFKLLKSKIVVTSTKLVDWDEIKAANKDITLEN